GGWGGRGRDHGGAGGCRSSPSVRPGTGRRRHTCAATSSASFPSRTPPPSPRSSKLWYNPPVVAGGGFLRTGCGPGPLEPALGNSSEGNATDVIRPAFSTAPDEVRFFYARAGQRRAHGAVGGAERRRPGP